MVGLTDAEVEVLAAVHHAGRFASRDAAEQALVAPLSAKELASGFLARSPWW